MANPSNPDDRAGWEQSGAVAIRRVTRVWRAQCQRGRMADGCRGGFVLDIGCGVGRHLVYLGGRGFKMAGRYFAERYPAVGGGVLRRDRL
jgi:SAM-dependent methyltransferase